MTALADDRILEGLSGPQREAVTHGEGPLLIIAGAGTGKTTVLTRRIAHLISTKRARPEEILALTFTEKAAAEMAERVDQLIPYGYAETWISTFHSFGDRVLRETALEVGMNPEFRVLTEPELVIFLQERVFSLPLRRYRSLGNPARHLRSLVSFVSRAKDEDISPGRYREWAEERLLRATTPEAQDEAGRHLELSEFYAACQAMLAEAGLADFGDQIYRTLEVLRRRPAVLERLRKRHRYILVDEFQDTNHAQLEMLRLLAGEGEANITVVGDDDQAIYRWRGAAVANLLAFREIYPTARQVVLVENHRSWQPVLDAAARLVAHNNPHRLEVLAGIDKRLRATREGGVPVRHIRYDTVSTEADGVATMIDEALVRGFRPRDVAILVRSNGDADAFQRALNVRRIPHRFSGSRGLYAREEVRLLVAFLRLLANPADSVSAFYLAASEVYGLPETDLLRLNAYARQKTRPLLEVFRGLADNEDLVGVGGDSREASHRLVADLDVAAQEVPRRRTGEVLYSYLQRSGLLGRLAREATAENEARVRNIARFFDVVKGYGDVAEHDRVPAFVEHLDLLREAGDDPAVAEPDVDEDAVHVLTVHKAKGLEFPVVFIVGCAELKFPIQRRGDPLALPDELLRETLDASSSHYHEERRLFYVAMTRARDELVLTSAQDYGTGRQRKLSRFVVEALDLPGPLPVPRKSRALEVLARNQPPPELPPPVETAMGDEEALRLSFNQIDDYETCPLKYRYVHILRVPLLTHHAVVYGHAVHQAVQRMFEARLAGMSFGEDDLVAAFRGAWVSEGFLSREHEERRLAAGEEALRRFAAEQATAPWSPTAVEQEFQFAVGRNRVQGRYDLLIERHGEVAVVDFKTGDVRDQETADRRAKESFQLDIYALARLRTAGRLPDLVELRFLESGLVGAKRPTEEVAREAEARISAVAAAIRKREFPALPTWRACGQCPFREICPHTSRTSEGGDRR